MKKAKVEYLSVGFTEVKEFEYKEDFSVEVDDGIVYFIADGEMQLAISKEYFISLEKVEKGDSKNNV